MNRDASFVLASGAASAISSSRWERLADGAGGQRPMLWGGVVAVIAGLAGLALKMLGDGQGLHWVCWPGLYFVFSIGYAGVRVGRKTYVVDIVQGNQRTAPVAASNTVLALVFIGASLASYATLLGFGSYVALSAAGCLSCLWLRSSR